MISRAEVIPTMSVFNSQQQSSLSHADGHRYSVASLLSMRHHCSYIDRRVRRAITCVQVWRDSTIDYGCTASVHRCGIDFEPVILSQDAGDPKTFILNHSDIESCTPPPTSIATSLRTDNTIQDLSSPVNILLQQQHISNYMGVDEHSTISSMLSNSCTCDEECELQHSLHQSNFMSSNQHLINECVHVLLRYLLECSQYHHLEAVWHSYNLIDNLFAIACSIVTECRHDYNYVGNIILLAVWFSALLFSSHYLLNRSNEFHTPIILSQRDLSIRTDARKSVLTYPPRIWKQRKPRQHYPVPSILLANARSVSNKVEEIATLLTAKTPTIFAVCETWLDNSTPDGVLAMQGYNIIRKDRNTFGGGLLIYVASHLSTVELTESVAPCLSNTESEILPIIIPELNLLFILLYHPFWGSSPQHNLAKQALINLSDLSTYPSSTTTRRLFICGDFNGLSASIPIICNAHNLTSLVKFPTRAGATLDHMLTDFSHLLQPPTSLTPLGRSDHVPVFILPKSKSQLPAIKGSCRKVTPASLSTFATELEKTDWVNLVSGSPTLDEATDALHYNLKALFEHHFPPKVIRIRHGGRRPWITPALQITIDARDKAYTEHKVLKYLNLKEKVIKLSHSLKTTYLARELNTKSPREGWKAIKSLCGLTATAKHHSLDVEKCNSLFSSAFGKASLPDAIIKNIVNSDAEPDSKNQTPEIPVAVVEKHLAHLKRAAPGIDGLPYWIFRDFRYILSPAITCLFNRSLNECTVPFLYKLANISPIPKKPNPSENDYRPISLLPILGKVLERIVLKTWLEPSLKQFLDPLQFAFTPGVGKGTTTALTLINHEILSFLDTPGAVRLIQLDFSKAFDTVQHAWIFHCLEKRGVSINLYKWLFSYLNNRCQRVMHNGNSSEFSPITSGVPQGSVIGPFLFALAINDIHPVSPNTTLIKYADDISIIHKLRHGDVDQCENELSNVIQWSNDIDLRLNSSKCSVLDFCTTKKINLVPIKDPQGVPLPNVDSLRILGVTFTNDFKWTSHVNNVTLKAWRLTGLIKLLRNSGCSADWCWRVYNSLIRSTMTYAFPAWRNVSATNLMELSAIEKRVARIVGAPHTRSLQEFLHSLCVTIANQVREDSSHPLRCLFISEKRRCSSRRNPHQLQAPIFAKTSRFKKSMIMFSNIYI